MNYAFQNYLSILTDSKKKLFLIVFTVYSVFSIYGGFDFLRNNYEYALKANPYPATTDMYSSYIGLALAVVIAEYLIYRFFYFVFYEINNYKKYAIYFLVAFVLLIIKNQHVFSADFKYTSDEFNIWCSAITLYPFYFLYTSEFYLISFFIIPVGIAPTLLKFFLVAFTLVFIAKKLDCFTKSHFGIVVFLVFLVKDLKYSFFFVHRMYWYSLFYVLVLTILYFDKQTSFRRHIVFIILLAILTSLRREGICLLIFAPFILYKGTDYIKKLVTYYLLSFILLLWPYSCGYKLNDGNVVYQSTVVHMIIGNELDVNEDDEDMRIVKSFIDTDKILEIHKEKPLLFYFDTIWAYDWYEDGIYYCLKEYNPKFNSSVINIVKKHPIEFIKSRVKAFNSISSIYPDSHLVLGLIALFILFAFALINKIYSTAIFLAACCCHVMLTALMMPACYFKYFLEVYYIMYLTPVFILAFYIRRWRLKNICEHESFVE